MCNFWDFLCVLSICATTFMVVSIWPKGPARTFPEAAFDPPLPQFFYTDMAGPIPPCEPTGDPNWNPAWGDDPRDWP